MLDLDSIFDGKTATPAYMYCAVVRSTHLRMGDSICDDKELSAETCYLALVLHHVIYSCSVQVCLAKRGQMSLLLLYLKSKFVFYCDG